MGEYIELDTPVGPAEAYVTRPDGAGHPGVIFFMDAIGLRPRIEEMADRIAGWGYVVLAPNVFHRHGRVADLAPTADLRIPEEREAFFIDAMKRVRSLTARVAATDLPAYVSALRGLAGVGPGPIGVTGYCMGARLAVRAACLEPEVAAVGAFHGGGIATTADDSPHLGLGAAHAEFVFGHADRDRSMDAEAVARLEAALVEAGLVHRNEVYPGVTHGYTMADTAAWDEAATERHFIELEELFQRALRPGRSGS